MSENAEYRMATEDAVDLSADEVAAVARRLVAKRINEDDDWPSWEDFPLFSESTFMHLSDAIDRLRREAWRAAGEFDRSEDIDSVALLDEGRGQ